VTSYYKRALGLAKRAKGTKDFSITKLPTIQQKGTLIREKKVTLFCQARTHTCIPNIDLEQSGKAVKYSHVGV
jgi:hypothetical protein